MNLNPLDETLLHQTPEPFGTVTSSDHRWFDRDWFGCFSKAGDIGLITGIGAYSNMNVLDGFAAVQHAGLQYNVRASRQFRPQVDQVAVGPIRHEIVEPLQSVRLVVEPGEHEVAFDLLWEGTFPAHLEPRHRDRLDGRVYQDYSRFDQMGSVSGWVDVRGARFEASDWVGIRDHSWGVRRSVGGFEPFTGTMPPEIRGSLMIWLEFATADVNGHVQIMEDGSGNRSLLEGFMATRESRAEVVDVEHDIEFHDGMRAYKRATLQVTTDDGATWAIEAEPVLTAWAYKGTGYDNGFNDGKGLGAFRGSVVEHDCYDVSHPEQVGTPNGVIVPFHREQHVRLSVNGEVGYGHLPVMPIGRNERYGFPDFGS
jgi:hypothetical protein